MKTKNQNFEDNGRETQCTYINIYIKEIKRIYKINVSYILEVRDYVCIQESIKSCFKWYFLICFDKFGENQSTKMFCIYSSSQDDRNSFKDILWCMENN